MFDDKRWKVRVQAIREEADMREDEEEGRELAERIKAKCIDNWDEFALWRRSRCH